MEALKTIFPGPSFSVERTKAQEGEECVQSSDEVNMLQENGMEAK